MKTELNYPLDDDSRLYTKMSYRCGGIDFDLDSSTYTIDLTFSTRKVNFLRLRCHFLWQPVSLSISWF
jgi:hypothetical protein